MPINNYIGTQIGFLTIEQKCEEANNYIAKCRCGSDVTLTASQVRRGNIHACPECMKKYFPHRTHDITGKRFGVLEVLHPDIGEDGKYHRKWRCKCIKCGEEITTTVAPLKNGTLFYCRFCGAGKVISEAWSPEFSLRGQRFGKLTVHYKLSGGDDWLCHCDCGETEELTREELLSGKYLECHQCTTERQKRRLERRKMKGIWT